MLAAWRRQQIQTEVSISRMKIHPAFHISLLEVEPTENPETDENIEAHEEEFEVEKFLEHRVRNDVV